MHQFVPLADSIECARSCSPGVLATALRGNGLRDDARAAASALKQLQAKPWRSGGCWIKCSHVGAGSAVLVRDAAYAVTAA